MSTYILDQTWEKEAERLRALEVLYDPTTFDHLDNLGVGAGWRCLEVGAGRGSVAARLAGLVGPSGHVLAVDLDTTLLEPLASPVIEVRRADITTDELPGGFDLVHARLVVGHIEDRRGALLRLTSCLRPGGLLLIEEADFIWTDLGEWPVYGGDADPALFLKVWTALIHLWKFGGYDAHWGRGLPGELIAAGLRDVEGEIRSRIVSTTRTLAQLGIERFRDALIASGGLTAEEIDDYLASTGGDLVMTSPLQVSAWGRRAG